VTFRENPYGESRTLFRGLNESWRLYTPALLKVHVQMNVCRRQLASGPARASGGGGVRHESVRSMCGCVCVCMNVLLGANTCCLVQSMSWPM
jgi:hypothetical protein